jgi:hypothetical protein
MTSLVSFLKVNALNESTDSFSHVLPNDLIKSRPFEFPQLITLHTQRLQEFFREEKIISINDEFKKIKDSFRIEE